MVVSLVGLVAATLTAPTMRAVHAVGDCGAPFVACIQIVKLPVPTPSPSQVLIRVDASSINPSDVDTVEAGGCARGCGADVAGVVVACPSCKSLKVGDSVWGFAQPAYSDFALTTEEDLGLKPTSLRALDAGTIPEVGLTSLFSLKRTGSLPGTPLPAGTPWKNFSNLTVVVTAGSGGTGSVGIQMAKAWGAKAIATATTGVEGFAFVRSLGATYVTDYRKEDLFASLPDDSVDIVYDNYGAEGTADRAMRTIRPGGMYLMMPHGECYEKKTQGPPCLSANPKPGVRQLNYVTGPDFEVYSRTGLDELAALVTQGVLTTQIDRVYGLDTIASAFNYSAGPGEGGVGSHIGKIAISMAS